MQYCNCGNVAYAMCQMTTHQCEPFPICDDCMKRNDQVADEINDHEMRVHGGAYGLVTYHYTLIKKEIDHPVFEVIPVEFYSVY